MQTEESKEVLFTKLVDQHYAYLFSIGIRLTNNSSDAEDILQEAFLRAWVKFDSLRKPESAKYWLAKIVKNENARRFEKKRLKLVSVAHEDLENLAVDNSEIFSDADYWNRAIAQLPEIYSKPLYMQVINGNTCKEIAKEMGITSNTAIMRVFRAKHRLRSILESDTKDFEDYASA